MMNSILKPRIYLDTSVIGGCKDLEFAKWSQKILDSISANNFIAVVSDLTRDELDGAPEPVRQVLFSIPEACLENIILDEEAERLAMTYIEFGAVSQKSIADAQHIAMATIHRVDALISWNFRHIVNLGRIRAYNSVNLRLGYSLLEIRSPREILDEKDI